MTETPQTSALVLFYGVCNLCNRAVQWLLARDRRECSSFASLQSQAARQALDAAGVADVLLDSIVLVENGRVWTRSDGVLRTAAQLGLPWSLAGVARVLPRPLRDALYAWIARHRYAWFGKRDACLVPSPALRRRFIDDGRAAAERAACVECSEGARALASLRLAGLQRVARLRCAVSACRHRRCIEDEPQFGPALKSSVEPSAQCAKRIPRHPTFGIVWLRSAGSVARSSRVVRGRTAQAFTR